MEQLGELARWSPVAKVRTLLLGNTVFFAGFGFFLFLLSSLEGSTPGFDSGFGRIPRILSLASVAWLVLCAAGSPVQRRWPESRAYGVLGFISMVGFNAALFIEIGIFSSLTWLSIMGVATVLFAVFEERTAWAALLAMLSIFIAYSLSVAFDRMSYRDLMALSTGARVEISGHWLIIHWLTTGPIAIVGIWILSKLLGQWRIREQRFESASITDPLTKAFNRRRFMELLERLCESERQIERQFAVALFDLDHFKRINDTHGHTVGDLALQSVAETLKSTLRDNDLVARFGGEEFVVLLPGCDSEFAYSIIERCRKAIEGQSISTPTGTAVPVTASVGITVAGSASLSPQALLNEADKALYEAKESGRNRTVLWRRPPE